MSLKPKRIGGTAKQLLALAGLLFGASIVHGQSPPANVIQPVITSDQFFLFHDGSNHASFSGTGYRNEFQWAFLNTGEPTSYFASNGAPAQFTESGSGSASIAKAWRIQSHASNVPIALLDSRIFPHLDLQGVIRTSAVFNVLTNSTHGINAAGIIAANGNNALGIAGVLKDGANLMSLEGFSYAFYGDAMIWAIERGARIIYFPTGATTPRREWTNAFQTAFNSNVLVVCAGSESGGQEIGPAHADYPCMWSDTWSNILTVGASVRAETLYAGVTDYSAHWLHMVAPGRAIVTLTTNGYTYTSGTSPAAALAVGAAALCMERYPGETCFQIKERLMASADRREGYEGKCSSGGLNAYAALTYQRLALPRYLSLAGTNWETSVDLLAWTNWTGTNPVKIDVMEPARFFREVAL